MLALVLPIIFLFLAEYFSMQPKFWLPLLQRQQVLPLEYQQNTVCYAGWVVVQQTHPKAGHLGAEMDACFHSFL